MVTPKKVGLFLYGLIKRHAPAGVKKTLWDKEFTSSKWDFIDDTIGDCVYPYLEKYARGGDILDLGCGPGNTANEVKMESYRAYMGVDISEAALEKGRIRSEASGRGMKNTFAQGDFIAYDPAQEYDVILFRESMYHVPVGKVKSVLDRYSRFLTDTGVLMVRMVADHGRPKTTMDIIEKEFSTIEKFESQTPPATVIVFRPKG